MKSSLKLYFISFVLMISFMLLVSSCTEKSGVDDVSLNSDKLSVVTTIFPLYEFATAVGGEKVSVTLLLPPGVEPHHFELKPSDVGKISDADVFLYIGDSMEPWAKDILDGIDSDLVVVKVSSFIDLIESENGGFDPHVWLDFNNDILIVKKLVDVFSSFNDGVDFDYYNSNANNYISKLDNLNDDYMSLSKLGYCNKSMFIVGGHNFFGYLSKRYNVSAVSAIDNLEPNSEPTPKRIELILDAVKTYDVSYILTEELLSPKLAKVISKEAGVDVLVFNPAGNIAKSDFESGKTFVSIMYDNLDVLKKALECSDK